MSKYRAQQSGNDKNEIKYTHYYSNIMWDILLLQNVPGLSLVFILTICLSTRLNYKPTLCIKHRTKSA